jgi:hypothetical protein
VIVNTTPVAVEADCGYYNYTLALADAAAAQLIKAPLVPDDPDPYVPPRYDEQGSALLGTGTAIDIEEAPFPPLYPDYLPPEYTFAHIVKYTTADLLEYEQDYAPGGEPIIALEYAGDDLETYLSITESTAPYKNVEAWVNAQGYSENDLRLVDNKPVYLIDYSDEGEAFSSATFVHHNLFIVIDGTFDRIEMQHVVASFLANNP